MRLILLLLSLFGLLHVSYATIEVEVDEARSSSGNDPICLDILDNWWSLRSRAIKNKEELTNFDAVCKLFSSNRTACSRRFSEVRREFIQTHSLSIADEDAAVPCTMLGAKSGVCVGNPCNHLNTGDCTLQNTGGLCTWWTKEQANLLNDDNIEYGCQRNPCHMGGSGKTPNACRANKHPLGLYSCTWCKGQGRLQGLGMGCQRNDVLFSDAECAPINDPTVPKDTIYFDQGTPRCQCTDRTVLCDETVGRNPNFRKRFPNAI